MKKQWVSVLSAGAALGFIGLAFLAALNPKTSNESYNYLSAPYLTAAPADPRLTEAQKQNPDTVAWLTVPGTPIDGPVQQAADNEYYLRRNELGEPSHEGCIYADYECIFTGEELSTNTILYGHTFTRPDQDPDLGFGQLARYLNPKFAEENSQIFLSVKDKLYTYKVVSAGQAAIDAEQASILAEPSQDQLQELVSQANARNVLSGALDASAGQKLLTLSTCTADAQARLLIVAELQ